MTEPCQHNIAEWYGSDWICALCGANANHVFGAGGPTDDRTYLDWILNTTEV